jgi:hypothetical protein
LSNATGRTGAVDSTATASSEHTSAFEKRSADISAKPELPHIDPDREFVLRSLRGLVESGVAEWTVLESGDIRLSLASGVIFNLGQDGVTRIA